MSTASALSASIANDLHAWQESAARFVANRKHIVLSVAGFATVAAFLPLLWKTFNPSLPRRRRSPSDVVATDPRKSDPSILKKHTSYRSFVVPSTGFTYPSIRTVYRSHPQTDKLPQEPSSLPLLVFIHGLGGSTAQFAPLLTSLINVGPCLCVDLPGCGLSDLAPEDWDAYTQSALASLLATIIDHYRDATSGQGVILIAHSMGCSLSARLAAGETSPDLSKHIAGVAALCPAASPPSEAQKRAVNFITSMPAPLFDLFRAFDKIGGLNSRSVSRFAGPNPAVQTRKLQYRFNAQSRSETFQRIVKGTISDKDETGLAGHSTWDKIEAPLLFIAGESDNLTAPEGARKLAARLAARHGYLKTASHNNLQGMHGDGNPVKGVKISVLPKPASHSLLFAPEQCRIVSGLIQSFLADHIDKRLSLGWQLQYLSTEGKWDVKNLEKWRRIKPVSEPIAGIFRAMKTMREVDAVHSPTAFAETWKGHFAAIVDISHDTPVYDPARLERGGIEYHKFPTVSKLPPSSEEVHSFIELVESIRSKHPGCVLAVHCHYGTNRSGFVLICYLVEKLGWRLEDALNEFKDKRPPGIKHQHFIDELYVRYSGLDVV